MHVVCEPNTHAIMYDADCGCRSIIITGGTKHGYRKVMMAVRQLTSCLMASCLLLSTSASAVGLRARDADAAAAPRPGKEASLNLGLTVGRSRGHDGDRSVYNQSASGSFDLGTLLTGRD